MEKRGNGFTVIGSLFSTLSNWAGILSYIGIPLAVVLAILKNYLWAFCVASIIGIVWISIRVCIKYRCEIVKFVLRLFAPNARYCYSLWESTYEYKSLDTMTFHSRYHVKALQTGVDHILVRFNWSGATDTNPIHPKPAKEGCTTKNIEFDGDEYGYKYYKVYNKIPFNKGDPEVKLGVDINEMKVSSKKEVSHHLLNSINVVTDKLRMKVILPKNIYPSSVVAHEFLHATDDNHWRDRSSECQPIRQTDGKWIITWEIEKPVFGGKYIIYWDPSSTTN